MKNLSLLFLAGTILLASCGGAGNDEEIEAVEVREVNKELMTLITNLADCKEQNTNCEAYTKASEGIQKLTDDEKKRDSIIGDLIYIIETGPKAQKQAAAHATSFWVGTSDFKNNAEYGQTVLTALKEIEQVDGEYTGSQLGQLLSKWWENEDKSLREGMIAFTLNSEGDRLGRQELVRLIPYKTVGQKDVFSTLEKIINNVNEDEYLRTSALSSMSNVDDAAMKQTARSIFESYLSNPSVTIANAAMRSLGYMKSVESWDRIAEVIRANKDVKEWYSAGSGCLTSLSSVIMKKTDKKLLFDLTKEMILYDDMDAYYRSYYIYTLSRIDTPEAKLFLKELKFSKEKIIADEAKRILAF